MKDALTGCDARIDNSQSMEQQKSGRGEPAGATENRQEACNRTRALIRCLQELPHLSKVVL